MPALAATADAAQSSRPAVSKGAVVAWLVAAFCYFYQYSLRSAPSVMMPQLLHAFGFTALGMTSLLGLFYYGYAFFSLAAGPALDRFGPRKTMPLASVVIGGGAILFSFADGQLALIGRLLQGAGAAFVAVGAIYIASNYFPASRAATLIGATQMFGMAGGSAGQFVVGPIIAAGVPWDRFWAAMGITGFAVAIVLFLFLPRKHDQPKKDDALRAAAKSFLTIINNRQSVLCGFIAGLLFIPTTIFDMTWGVRYLQDAHSLDYSEAVIRSATVPLGWIVGCPLLGFISDRLGRRKPVIIASALLLGCCLAWILFGPVGTLPRYSLGFLAGVSSGAAMLTYTVIKEANPPQYAGTATGVISFLNFTFSAFLGPVFSWLLHLVSRDGELELRHYQLAFAPLLLGVACAIVLTLFLNETGSAARTSS